MVDKVDKKTRSYIMSRIRSKWTTPEKLMHGHLKSRKIRHTMHPPIEGNPDVWIKDSKLVVFIDGDFWHGKNYVQRAPKLQPFWKDKIKTNMIRDRKYNRLLRDRGWTVLRLWEEDVKKRPEWCMERIKAYI